MLIGNQTFLLRFLYSSVWRNVGISHDDFILAFVDTFNTATVIIYAAVCYQVSLRNPWLEIR